MAVSSLVIQFEGLEERDMVVHMYIEKKFERI